MRNRNLGQRLAWFDVLRAQEPPRAWKSKHRAAWRDTFFQSRPHRIAGEKNSSQEHIIIKNFITHKKVFITDESADRAKHSDFNNRTILSSELQNK